MCNLGTGFQVRQDPIAEQIGHSLRGMGCQARVECSMTGVFRTEGETVAPGRLDVFAFGRSGPTTVLVDVAVKHPCRGPLERQAAQMDGHAATLAEREKLKEYIMPAGEALTPFGVETFGRFCKAPEALVGEDARCLVKPLKAARGKCASDN